MKKRKTNFLVATLLAGAAIAAAGPAAATTADLALHRAVYDLSLADSTDDSAIGGAAGRMVYDVSGSACDGYTTNLRFVTQISDTEGNGRVTDVHTSTFEDGAGKRFRFATRTYVDGNLSEDTVGSADRSSGTVRVELTKPEKKSFELPAGVLFPTQHLEALLEAAEAGRHFVQIDLFDGSDKGDKPYATSAVIGAALTGPDTLADGDAATKAGIDAVARWPVTLSYFDGKEAAKGEETPVYELSFLLYENGITRRMKLDYGGFALEGRLVDLEIRPQEEASCGKR